MSLYARGNVYWSSLYMDGIRYQQSTGTGTRRLALVIERQFRDTLNLKRHQVPLLNPAMPFRDLAARFLAEGGARPYHADRLKVLLPFFGGIPIGQISKGLVERYRRVRHSTRELTEATVNRDLESLRRILNFAVDDGLLVASPLHRLHLPREPRRPRPVMSLEEESLLLEAAAPHLREIIVTALDTGMRRGEILSQRWQDVDFSRRLLYVSHSKTPEGTGREIVFTSRLFALLQKRRQPEGLIFTFDGRPVKQVKTAWATALRKAGIRRCRFHDLRHAFNTRLMEAGILREIRMAMMGHANGEDVHSRYTHIELPTKREAIRKLEAWVEAQQAINHQPRTTFQGGECNAIAGI
jgi:integrase